jgi:hypothetical protein
MSEHHSGDEYDFVLYDQGDNAGSGPTDFNATSLFGLNGMWIRIYRAIKGVLHADGTLKNDSIGGAALKNDIVDGSTLEATAATGAKQYRIKDAGVTSAKYADISIGTGKLIDKSVTDAKVANHATDDAQRAIGPDHIKDASILERHLAAGILSNSKIGKTVGTFVVYSDMRAAGTAAGNTPAAITEWTETAASVIKHSFFLPNYDFDINSTYKLRVRCSAKTDNAARAWTVQLTDAAGSVLATQSGTNTSYNGTAFEVDLSYLVSQFGNRVNGEYQVRVGVANPGTMTFKNVDIFITAG